MVNFKAVLKKFDNQGEKTGWTYIEIDEAIAQKLKPKNKKSFRVKGFLDQFVIKGVALIPMGEGNFIMAVNAAMRKGIGKRKGAEVKVKLELDVEPLPMSAELIACLEDEPKALKFFKTLSPGHQNYYSKWIESAKTDATKAKRIAQAVNALSKGLHYGLMIRALKAEKDERGN